MLNVCVGFAPTTLSLASSRQCCRSAKLKSARLRYKDDPCPVHNSIHAHAAWQNCPSCHHVPPHRRLSPRRNPHSCGTDYDPPPRFRALALFGRRPPERVVSIVGAGVRKPAHKRPPALQKKALEVGPPARCNPFPCDPDRSTLPV